MERTKHDKEIKTPFMVRWTKCERCGNEFRFERMYRFKTLSFWKAYNYRYGCMKCFNDKEEFYDYMVEKDKETCGINTKEIYIEGGGKKVMIKTETKPIPPSLRIEEEKW